jgi:tRNA pseudouridine55 synthase
MNPMNGVLLVDKPKGITSHDVVARTRRILGIRSIGHAGTLDPLASGLLILLIGEGTKVSDYLLNGDKSYEVNVRLGLKTDSMDVTGKTLAETGTEHLSLDLIQSAALKLCGPLQLQVPIHSAVKVDGRKLYEFAHRGVQPADVPTREMVFTEIEVLSVSKTLVRIKLRCTKGSFVRAWANRLGDDLGVGGTVEELRRIHSDPFAVTRAISLEEIAAKWSTKTENHGQVFGNSWVALSDCLPHLPVLEVEGREETFIKNGQIANNLHAPLLALGGTSEVLPPVRVISRESRDLIAILSADSGQSYKIRRVFQTV